VPDPHGRPRQIARVPQQRRGEPGLDGAWRRREPFEPLPDLAGGLAAVPGGLGAEVGTPFTFAGQRWVPADATPIGAQLAAELRDPTPAPTLPRHRRAIED